MAFPGVHCSAGSSVWARPGDLRGDRRAIGFSSLETPRTGEPREGTGARFEGELRWSAPGGSLKKQIDHCHRSGLVAALASVFIPLCLVVESVAGNAKEAALDRHSLGAPSKLA